MCIMFYIIKVSFIYKNENRWTLSDVVIKDTWNLGWVYFHIFTFCCAQVLYQ